MPNLKRNQVALALKYMEANTFIVSASVKKYAINLPTYLITSLS